jgi:hypothetical protein
MRPSPAPERCRTWIYRGPWHLGHWSGEMPSRSARNRMRRWGRESRNNWETDASVWDALFVVTR